MPQFGAQQVHRPVWLKIVLVRRGLAKVCLAQLRLAKVGLGQTWFWPKLVWPNLVWPKLAKPNLVLPKLVWPKLVWPKLAIAELPSSNSTLSSTFEENRRFLHDQRSVVEDLFQIHFNTWLGSSSPRGQQLRPQWNRFAGESLPPLLDSHPGLTSPVHG